MPPDLPNEQELNLKKRARRRLVGAVALVLVMVIVLPRILQDRAALAQQESIKITMPNAGVSQEPVAVAEKIVAPQVESIPESLIPEPSVPVSTEPTPAETVVASNALPGSKNESNADSSAAKSAPVVSRVEHEKPAVKNEKKAEVKSDKPKAGEVKISEPKSVEAKSSELKTGEIKVNEPGRSDQKIAEPKTVKEPKPAEAPKTAEVIEHKKSAGGFTVQVGVYSDADNVKRLQAKIKELGYSTHTENVTTPKGEKTRLKAGSFSTRADAIQAQAKLQKIGLAGMVVGND